MEFYLLKDIDEPGFKLAYWNYNKITNHTCEICEGINSQNVGPLVISFEGKGKIADYYRIVKWHTISPELKQILIDHKITGIQFKDILIDDEKGNLLTTDLNELHISGRCGLLTDINGEIIPHCPKCNRVTPDNVSGIEGLSLNLNNWDGSDMFYFSNWEGNIIVTEKVKKLIEKSKYPYIYFENINSHSF